MKKIFPFLLVLLSCSENKKIESLLNPTLLASQEEWITYEGIILTEAGFEAAIELSLLQDAVGVESAYKLKASFDQEGNHVTTESEAKYSVRYGSDNNEVIIEVPTENSLHVAVGTNVKSPAATTFQKKLFKTLYLKTEGPNQLVLLDNHLHRIADDSRYTLYKRSKLFTAEGYITFEEKRTDFYEKNTNESWTVAPLGFYNAVKENYDSLATQALEGVYLKALAYSVQADSTDEERLVIKSVLEMTRSKAYEKAN